MHSLDLSSSANLCAWWSPILFACFPSWIDAGSLNCTLMWFSHSFWESQTLLSGITLLGFWRRNFSYCLILEHLLNFLPEVLSLPYCHACCAGCGTLSWYADSRSPSPGPVRTNQTVLSFPLWGEHCQKKRFWPCQLPDNWCRWRTFSASALFLIYFSNPGPNNNKATSYSSSPKLARPTNAKG